MTKQAQQPNPDMQKNDIKLSICLKIEDASNESIVDVNQSVVIPSLKEPMFLPDAYLQIEQMLNILALEPMKRKAKTYFSNLLKQHQSCLVSDIMPKDAKIVIEATNLEPEGTATMVDPLEVLDKEGITGDTSNVNPEDHYNMEVEEQEEQQSSAEVTK